MQEYKLIIAGGNDFSDYQLLFLKVNNLIDGLTASREIIIISGVANGAEMLGERYAAEMGYEVAEFPGVQCESNEETHLRNGRMVAFADAGICFWDGRCPITKRLMDWADSINFLMTIVLY